MRCGSGGRTSVLAVLMLVLGASGSKIYYPGNLHEIPEDIAIRKCLKNPTCVLPPHLASSSRCEGGSGVREMIEKMKGDSTTTRAGGEGVCNGMAGEVVWPDTGECVGLLTQGPCSPGQWVMLLKDTYEPVCQHQPCELPLSEGGGPGVVIEETCYPTSQLPPAPDCPNNLEWVTNEHGELECDCAPGLVFYPGEEVCYQPYSQGPCAPGWIIKVEDTEGGGSGEAKCFPNECPEEKMVTLEDSTCRLSTRANTNAHCYPIGTNGPCLAGSFLTVDDVLAEPICLTTHSVFSNVVNRCARGTRRDRVGRCRSSFDSILSSVPIFRAADRPRRGSGGNGVCPPDQFFAGGTCIQVVQG